ncbi:pathogenesis-related protein 1A [Cucumis sativus]|uniref:SCP domain-containing protein n=1 Tax=Cucumis sativus TaxID=3659 RepID=A0A0A0K7N5_CUCSA|nr:pathogenesis-related protein 1A [Cucumis sativus]KGN43826.1 hypothetical protein Csa_017168 [Cucumis sativus]
MGFANILSTLCLLGLTLTLTLTLTLASTAPSLAKSSPKNYIDAHNAVRAAVGVEPLHWNSTLADYAQNYANTKIATCQMEHSGGPYGENLAEGNEVMTAETAVSLWADEKKHYDYNSNTCSNDPSNCLHYTQLVWSNTKSVGCAQVKCQNNWVFLICSYYPPGNYNGQRPY